MVPGGRFVRTRIWAAVAERTFGVLSDAGLARIGQARHIPLDGFIAFLDEGGSARYAARLKALSGIIGERYRGRAAMIGQQFSTYPALRAALGVLPGWGPGGRDREDAGQRAGAVPAGPVPGR